MDPRLKEALLAAAQVRTCEVTIGDLKVTVREAGALEFAAYGKLQKTDRVKATAALISTCVVDESGAPLFSAEEAAPIAASARMAMPIVTAIMQLSGLVKDEKEDNPGEPDAG